MVKQTEKKHSRLVHSGAWDAVFAEYITSHNEKLEKAKEQILEKRFTVKDSGATHRLINHWSEVGIIDDCSRTNEQGWRKLSVVDLIWLDILKELRRFGMPLESLKLAHRSTFYSHAKPDKQWQLLECCILRCLQRDSLLIIVFDDGWCEYLFKQDYYFNLQTGILNEKAYLVVNLNQFVSAVFPKLREPIFGNAVKLSNAELDVIEKLREGDLNELHVKLKNGEIQSLKKIYSGNDDYQGLIDKIEYGEYIVKRQNGKTVFTEVSEIQRVSS